LRGVTCPLIRVGAASYPSQSKKKGSVALSGKRCSGNRRKDGSRMDEAGIVLRKRRDLKLQKEAKGKDEKKKRRSTKAP